MQPSHKVSAVFDDPNLVSAAGLVPVLRLAESAGLNDLVAEHLSVDSPNPVIKTSGVVAGMLAGADSSDDLDLLRHGGLGRLFAGIRAPSTLGTYLRSFTHGHVQQLDAAASRLLAGLTTRVPRLLAGGQAFAFVDVDDTVREVHGYAKQAASYGYSAVRGLNAQVAAISTPIAAPVIGAARLRRGNVASGHGSGRLLAQAIGNARRAGVSGQILARADSAHYTHAFIAAALRAKAWFSVTARMDNQVTAAIGRIDEQAWTPITYPSVVFDDEEQRWISDAEVAEIEFTAFTSRRKRDHLPCRLVVRRVKRLNPDPAANTGQGELRSVHQSASEPILQRAAPDVPKHDDCQGPEHVPGASHHVSRTRPETRGRRRCHGRYWHPSAHAAAAAWAQATRLRAPIPTLSRCWLRCPTTGTNG